MTKQQKKWCVILLDLVFASLHVGLVHLHRVELHAAHLTHQGVTWRQVSVKNVKETAKWSNKGF